MHFMTNIFKVLTKNENSDFLAVKVLSGERLKAPVDCDPVLGHVMMLCWQAEPKERPNFDQIFRYH